MKKQILSNLGSNYLSKLLTMGLAFFIVPFLTRVLSKEVYGIVVLAETTILFFGVVTNSMKMSMTRFVTYSYSEGNLDRFLAYLASGRFLLIGCAVAAVVFGGVTGWFYPETIRMSPEYLMETKYLFFIITLGFTVSIPNIVFASVVNANQRPDLINMAASLAAITRAVLIVIVYGFFNERSMLAYGWIYFASNVVQNLTVYIVYRRLMPGVRIHRRHFDKTRAREIFSFGVHSAAGNLSELLYDNTAIVIIGYVWGPASVALYSISLKFAMIMKRLFLEGAWALAPTFISLVAKNETQKTRSLFFLYTKIMTLVITPLCILLIVLAHPIIRLWVGPEFAFAANIMPIHVIPLFMALPFGICACMTCAYGKVKIPSLMSFASAAVNVALGLVLGVVLGGGLYGIAAGAAISSIFYLAAFLPHYTCKISGIPLHEYFVHGFLKPFALSVLVFGGSVAGVYYFYRQNSLHPGVLSGCGVLAVLYVVLSFWFVLSREERRAIKEMFSSLFFKKAAKPVAAAA